MARLNETLIRVMNKIVRNEKTPRHYGVDVLLHPSEIHMVALIGNNGGEHVSELARIAGVTRGAVSQTVAKLEKKGLIRKVANPGNSLKTVPALTSKGKVAYWAHQQYHEEMDADLYDHLRRLSDEQIGAIEDFLRHFEKMTDRRH